MESKQQQGLVAAVPEVWQVTPRSDERIQPTIRAKYRAKNQQKNLL